jgi:hypothetical protein
MLSAVVDPNLGPDLLPGLMRPGGDCGYFEAAAPSITASTSSSRMIK